MLHVHYRTSLCQVIANSEGNVVILVPSKRQLVQFMANKRIKCEIKCYKALMLILYNTTCVYMYIYITCVFPLKQAAKKRLIQTKNNNKWFKQLVTVVKLSRTCTVGFLFIKAWDQISAIEFTYYFYIVFVLTHLHQHNLHSQMNILLYSITDASNSTCKAWMCFY